MKKLYLTSFVFTARGYEHKDYRLVVVTDKDVKEYKKEKTDTLQLDDWAVSVAIAYKKFIEWFPSMYPESQLICHTTYPAIE